MVLAENRAKEVAAQLVADELEANRVAAAKQEAAKVALRLAEDEATRLSSMKRQAELDAKAKHDQRQAEEAERLRILALEAEEMRIAQLPNKLSPEMNTIARHFFNHVMRHETQLEPSDDFKFIVFWKLRDGTRDVFDFNVVPTGDAIYTSRENVGKYNKMRVHIYGEFNFTYDKRWIAKDGKLQIVWGALGIAENRSRRKTDTERFAFRAEDMAEITNRGEVEVVWPAVTEWRPADRPKK